MRYETHNEHDPDVDTVLCCPECERPNQFGELCGECRRYEEYEIE